MPKKYGEGLENAAIFAKDRAEGVRKMMHWFQTSGKAPHELSRFLGIELVDGSKGKISDYASKVFRELVRLGVIEAENERFYLKGHKPSDRRAQAQQYGRAMPPVEIREDLREIDPVIAKRQQEFRTRQLKANERALAEGRRLGKSWGHTA
jgi:hypothetical protein